VPEEAGLIFARPLNGRAASVQHPFDPSS